MSTIRPCRNSDRRAILGVINAAVEACGIDRVLAPPLLGLPQSNKAGSAA